MNYHGNRHNSICSDWFLNCPVSCGLDLKFPRLTSSFSKNSVYSASASHVSEFIAFSKSSILETGTSGRRPYSQQNVCGYKRVRILVHGILVPRK